MKRIAAVGTPSPLVTRHVGGLDLGGRGAAHLAHALDDEVEAVHVRLGHPAAAVFDREPAAGTRALPPSVNGAALAAAAEAVALQGERDERAERVVDLGDVDVGGGEVGVAPTDGARAVQAGPGSGSSVK